MSKRFARLVMLQDVRRGYVIEHYAYDLEIGCAILTGRTILPWQH